ncbi:MAG: phosphoribosylamine--glycine ligase [Acholeplasmatales bacterium]|jgi:phosphoribosylamine--glycine ligase|nr:phosphoribosylamine--glycine ligase [Acholeplasmatales bacterium]
MRVLVVGAGGRCHAILDALKKSKHNLELYCAPGNAGIASIAHIVDIKETNVEALKGFALQNKIDLTVVGPEIALAAGIVNEFNKAGLKIFGPTKEAAQIETSKAYAKALMKKYHIPTAGYEVFSDYNQAIDYVRGHTLPIVLKYDGLAAGKGVVIATRLEEAEATLKDMLIDDKFGSSSVVIEDYLEGPEFSFMCFVSGADVYPLEVSQDHKRAYNNDLGPNTGGMGAYSGVPIISDSDKEYALKKIMEPTALALIKEGCPFKGVLYGGLMKTKDGIKVIEFNARFGDPETEVVLPKLKNDLFDVFCDIIDGNKVNLAFDPMYYLGVVLASKGYPGSYEKGYLIEGLEDVDGIVYHMGTKLEAGKYYTNGGRVLIVVAKGNTLLEAQQNANREASKIKSSNLFYRTDIGHRSL